MTILTVLANCCLLDRLPVARTNWQSINQAGTITPASTPEAVAVRRLGDADLQNMDLAGITTSSMSVLCRRRDGHSACDVGAQSQQGSGYYGEEAGNG